MNIIRKIHNKSYYRIRIILTFSLLTMILVIIMSRLSFYFLKDLYLDQLSDQVKVMSKMISNRIDNQFLDILQIGIPTPSTENYFSRIFSSYKNAKSDGNIFIFDSEYNIIVHSDQTVLKGIPEPRLFLNQNEIEILKTNETSTSLPFKGDDGKWYLWGFYRLSDNYWLGIQESADRLEKVDEFSTVFWIIGFGGILITIILGWVAANSITKPINHLVDFSSAIGKGNNNYPAPSGMKGELEVLSGAMEKMRLNLTTNQKEKENILAQIAHEIRNPLGGIELFAGLIKEDQQNLLKSTEYPDRILSEVHRLKLLITSYLDYSRPVKSSPQWINPTEILCELENMLSENFRKKEITVLNNNSLNKIYFDHGHLKQILLNLFSNCIESVPYGGNIKISGETNNSNWQISIQDNGTGVNPEFMPRIFDPFFTTKKEGTGLGLSICKKLAVENKADLKVKNNYPDGCTFILIKEIKDESL